MGNLSVVPSHVNYVTNYDCELEKKEESANIAIGQTVPERSGDPYFVSHRQDGYNYYFKVYSEETRQEWCSCAMGQVHNTKNFLVRNKPDLQLRESLKESRSLLSKELIFYGTPIVWALALLTRK